MADTLAEDNGSSPFDVASGGCSTNFDLFDFGFSYHDAEVSDASASASYGSTSTDISSFDNLSLGSATWERDLFSSLGAADADSTSTTTAISSRTSSNREASAVAPPPTQRQIHKMRPEGVAISRDQLLAIENKGTMLPLTAAFRHSDHDSNSPPSTPPRTTQPYLWNQPTPPPSSTRSRRMHRVEKKAVHSRSTSRQTQYRSGSPRAMSSAHVHYLQQQQQRQQQQQTPAQSPASFEWTEKLRRLVVQSPQSNYVLPVSPPLTTEINQAGTLALGADNDVNHGFGLGLDMADDFFGHSSSTTTGSSTDSKPSIDDIYSSATASSTWDLNTDVDLFGIKQEEPWGFSSATGGHSLLTSNELHHDPVHTLSQTHFNTDAMDTGFYETSNVQHGGLGICFPDTTFGNDTSQVFSSTSLIQPSDMHLTSSVKLPTMPFNTPISDFSSPALCPSNIFNLNCNIQSNTTHDNSSSPYPSPLTISAPSMSRRTTAVSTAPAMSPPAPDGMISTPVLSNPGTPRHRRTKSSTHPSTPTRSSHRSPSRPRQQRTPRGPKANHNAHSSNPPTKSSASASARSSKRTDGGGIGFVNFTPEDRNRILTGVAPSGSSKTKARREKEAEDKRRKFSEAARRLVSEAGGDVEVLERELSE